MSRRFHPRWLLLGCLAVLVLVVVIVVRERHGKIPFRNPDPVVSELHLPSVPREGRWDNAEEGAKWEETKRQIGIELSRRDECGPIRCLLRARPGAVSKDEPELAVELMNISDEAVTLRGHQLLLDYVTFIFRDADDKVVSTFCYAYIHSDFESKPDVILNPGEAKTAQLYLTVAADHGFQPLQPGQYSLEAVFHGDLFIGLPVPHPRMLARSKRLPVRVGES